VLVVQEVHRVRGTAVEEFEATTQQFWKAAAPLGVTPAWFFEVSHGTGPSYCVITGLRVDGWSAWEAYARAVAYGELSAVTEELDATRYDSESAVLDILSDVPPAAVEAASPGLWVQRFLKPDAGGEAAIGQPGLVMRGCVGGAPDGITILSKETPAAVLDILTGESDTGGVVGRAESTWVLRPSSWSPLQ
jgi:hypothetical protein